MKRFIHLLMTSLFGLTLSSTLILSVIPGISSALPAPATVVYSQAELDQLLAPIALYPDSLLSLVLTAAAYPQDVAQAAQFAQANPSTVKNPAALVRAMEVQRWDPSVKSLVQFPDVLAMMNSQPEWTQKLGDAFLGQQAAVMNTVQSLRDRALEEGSLIGCHQKVRRKAGAITIEPNVPNEIYVPYYNPTVVYGRWMYPEYVPFVWIPPIEYRPVFYATGFAFGIGIVIVDALYPPIYPDWHHHYLMRGDWHGHSDWQARTPWRANPDRLAVAGFRGATNQNRFQSSVAPSQSGNFGRNAQRRNNQPTFGAANNRAPLNSVNNRATRGPVNDRAARGTLNNRAARGPVNDRAAVRQHNRGQPNAGFSSPGAQARPFNNRGQVNNRASRGQPEMQQNERFSRGGGQGFSGRPGGSGGFTQSRPERQGFGGGNRGGDRGGGDRGGGRSQAGGDHSHRR